MTWEEILEEYNIYRNPSWIMLKGYGNFFLQSQPVDISLLSGGMGISNQDISSLEWDDKIQPDTILTIENLTSFHQWKAGKSNLDQGNREKVLCIYLGGYHNYSKRIFLKKLYQTYKQAKYFHFGDIDCGGFRIWKDLCQKTGIPFQTWKMDQGTYKEYLPFGRELTVNDRKNLEQMMADPFFEKQQELFSCMLQENLKIEQEAIS